MLLIFLPYGDICLDCDGVTSSNDVPTPLVSDVQPALTSVVQDSGAAAGELLLLLPLAEDVRTMLSP